MSFPAGQLELQLLLNPKWEWEVNLSKMKGVHSLLSAFLGFSFKVDIKPQAQTEMDNWYRSVGQLLIVFI